MSKDALLAVEDLNVSFQTGAGPVHAVRGVSLTLEAGQCLALVGESGSGKSVTARSLVGLTGPRSTVRAARLEFDGTDLSSLTENGWRRIRGRGIGLVLQDALVSLDPLRTVGSEVGEALREHSIVPGSHIAARSAELLDRAGVPDPAQRAKQYPHQLSGGLRQRALIASALAAEPRVLLADEPTTALDVTVQARILDLLDKLKREGTALLLISHDLAVVARLADHVAVMYAGEVVEHGPAAEILGNPQHTYTRELIAAVPRIDAPRAADSAPAAPSDHLPLLDVRAVSKRYRAPDGSSHDALNEVSFQVHWGETLGLVGESGSGKTTAARVVLGLLSPDTGEVDFAGARWSGRRERDRRALRGRIQTVPQDPLGSFDPRHTVGAILAEALAAAGIRERPARRERSTRLLDQVRLDPALLPRRPRELSGGQRQRVAIARALASAPDLLVCDEPVSALDVSVQAQILDLLADLRRALGLSMLFISHDLGVVREVSDRVAVMRHGRIVELTDADTLFAAPQHPYTRELLAAVPRIPLLPVDD